MRDSRDSHLTLLGCVVFGIGLDVCLREYLLPWFHQRRGSFSSILQRKKYDNTQKSGEHSPATCDSGQGPRTPVFLRDPTRPRVTEDDIAAGTVLIANTSRKVVRIGTDTIVKFGPHVNLDEVDSILFIRENTKIPVPQILDVYREDGQNYIVMEYMEGDLLKDVSLKMSAEALSVIIQELRHYICELRRIPAPEGVLIGTVNGGPATDRRQFGSAVGGPFRSEEEFNGWQLAQLHSETALSQRELYADVLTADHRVMFTHGDLAFHNVIVKDGHVNAILDWEYSGWYPEHWDYCKTRSFLEGTDGDYAACKAMFEKQYHKEHFLHTWMGREVRHGGF